MEHLCVPMDQINCDLIGAGASLHWLHVKAKNPVDARWSELPNRSESDLRHSYRPGQNIGVRLGQPSQVGGDFLHLVDLDIRDASKAGEAWAALLALWPAARGFPSVVSGSRRGVAAPLFPVPCGNAQTKAGPFGHFHDGL